jgi:T5SS/PEP-CTERM-associated repeat protein
LSGGSRYIERAIDPKNVQKSNLGASDDLNGTGMINTHGIVSDIDLVFDATHGLSQTFAINENAGQDITVNLDVDGSAALGAGYGGSGTLNISDGIVVNSTDGYVGYKFGSTGEVTVNGAGSTWTNSDEDLYIGYSGNGTLNITGGGTVNNYEKDVKPDYASNSRIFVGYNSGSIGTVTVGGADSILTNSGGLYVGYYGGGTLNITDGATVTNVSGLIGTYSDLACAVNVDGAGSTWNNLSGLRIESGKLNITNGGAVTAGTNTVVHGNAGLSGAIHFDNGTLTTGTLFAAGDELSGTGTINTHGIVSDIDLVFDATHGTNQTFTINRNVGQDITVNLDVDGSAALGAGYGGSGTMNVSDGIVVNSPLGYIGYKYGSTGEVTVDGAGSTWTNSRFLSVGYSGSGTLNITNGGVVSNGVVSGIYGQIGSNSSSTGEVTVDGAGSTWTSHYGLYVGRSGSGTLNITDGGVVKSYGQIGGNIGSCSGSTGQVTVDGTGSTWTNGRKLTVGDSGSGVLTITDSGLVSVVGQLMIDYDGDGDSFVNMGTGGMLALEGEADDSIGQFLGLVGGTDAIRYWDGGAWSHISGAMAGTDYTLEYLTGGELDGFTMLTVMTAVPEPSTIALILLGIGALLVVRRRR